MEADGYDRDAYDHKSMRVGKDLPQPSRAAHGFAQSAGADDNALFVFQRDGILENTAAIRTAAKLETQPEIFCGTGEKGDAKFCRVDTAAKQAIEAWLVQEQLHYRQPIVRDPRARKELSTVSIFPTLGMDSTLPQYRPHTNDVGILPAQTQYPIWYFFYGTLADPQVLSGHLGLLADDDLGLVPATVSCGILISWGTYRALVDGPSTSQVSGHVYFVKSEEQEDALRFYETEKYDVVRCTMTMDGDGREVEGCTFRFNGRIAVS